MHGVVLLTVDVAQPKAPFLASIRASKGIPNFRGGQYIDSNLTSVFQPYITCSTGVQLVIYKQLWLRMSIYSVN